MSNSEKFADLEIYGDLLADWERVQAFEAQPETRLSAEDLEAWSKKSENDSSEA